MATWLCTNLRGIAAFKGEGLHFSTPSDEAVKMFDSLQQQLVAFTDCEELGGIEGTMERMTNADPEAILPRAFKCAMEVLSTSTSFRVNRNLEKEILALEADTKKNGTDWEKKHVSAVKNWGYGHLKAAREIWEDILKDHPNDLLALKLAHDTNFFLGDAKEMRDSLARLLPKWKRHMPGYSAKIFSYLHGMYAFGLEESGQYREAEKEALLALEMNPRDCWASHARAHVLEMTGKYAEGLKFMEETVADWTPGAYLATHNYWHTAVYHIEQNNHEAALEVFDREVCPRTVKSSFMLDIVDATSLLTRLQMERVDVGDRWKHLPDLASHCYDHITSFNDCHFGTFFVGRGDFENEKKMHDSLVTFTRTTNNDNGALSRLVGLELYEGFIDYLNEKYTFAANKILPVRDQIVHIGGSHAQRDLFNQVLIHSCTESDEPKHWEMTPILLKERAAIREGSSPLAERLMLRFREKHPL